MKVLVSPYAKKQLKKLPKTIQILVAKKLRKFDKLDSFESKKLRGYDDIFRTRLGNYRIVYRKLSHSVYIILIAHRRETYVLTRRILR